MIPHDSLYNLGGCIKRFMEYLPKRNIIIQVYRGVKKNSKGFESDTVIGKTKIWKLFKNYLESSEFWIDKSFDYMLYVNILPQFQQMIDQ